MALKSERGWRVLLLGLLATVIIWSLGNMTPLFFDLALEGEISRTSLTSFMMGLYGVISGGLIAILTEKVGFLDESDFKKGRNALAKISGIAAEQIKETDISELREIVEARQAGLTLEEYRTKKEEAKVEPIIEVPPEPIVETPIPVVAEEPIPVPTPEPESTPVPEPTPEVVPEVVEPVVETPPPT